MGIRESSTSKLDFRVNPNLGFKESILTDSSPLSINSARGGFVPDVMADIDIVKGMAIIRPLLPPKVSLDQDGQADIINEINTIFDKEVQLISELHKMEDLGTPVSKAGIEYAKKAIESLRLINGHASVLSVLKDAPQEVQDGKIGSTPLGDESGRGMALHKVLMGQVYKGLEEDAPESIQHRQGPFVDQWRFLSKHDLMGLSSVLTGLHIRTVHPWLLQVRSTIMSRVFDSGLLVYLPRELGIANMGGIEALDSLSPKVLEDPSIKQSRNARLDVHFMDKLGTLQIGRYGPGETDFANIFRNHDAAYPFHYQEWFRRAQRRLLLLSIKQTVALRVTEWYLAQQEGPIESFDSQLETLHSIQKDVEEKMEKSGLAQLLKEELAIYRRTHAALNTLTSLVDSNSASNASSGGKGKSRESGLPRYHGLLARGEPHSDARKAQLEELKEDDMIAEKMGLPPPMVWDNRRPSEAKFQEKFMGVKLNLSFLRSCNAAGRTEAGQAARQKAAQEAGVRFGNWAKDKHARLRVAKTEGFDGEWGPSEQWGMVQKVIPELEVDKTDKTFEWLPRMGNCQLKCDRLVFGKSKNTDHKCEIDSKAAAISSTNFEGYEWTMLPHDVLDHPRLIPSVHVKAQTLTFKVGKQTFVYVKTLATEVLEGAPFHVDLHRLQEFCIYHSPEASPAFKLLMAMDIALREMCRARTPLQLARLAGQSLLPGAEEKYRKVYPNYCKIGFIDHVEAALKESRTQKHTVISYICCHCGDQKLVGKKVAWYEVVPKECKKLANQAGRGKQQFYEYEINSLSDLPYTVAKIVLYRTYRNDSNIDLRYELERWHARNS